MNSRDEAHIVLAIKSGFSMARDRVGLLRRSAPPPNSVSLRETAAMKQETASSVSKLTFRYPLFSQATDGMFDGDETIG